MTNEMLYDEAENYQVWEHKTMPLAHADVERHKQSCFEKKMNKKGIRVGNLAKQQEYIAPAS
jgi:hypothetical protein